eukprot:comp18023_c0_seq1/m.18523 comp18023_c0_seq1/g.18523  ORF comp18023_c0_seq1/g.18523 comp18023_c0_seq1/m.18523 type:complete len:434 (-) comp18023_c0_seq1:466-1767(-)
MAKGVCHRLLLALTLAHFAAAANPINITCQGEEGNYENVVCFGIDFVHHVPVSPGSTSFWTYTLAALACIISSGMFAGLTLGLLSLDTNSLKILSNCGTPREKLAANKLLPLLANRHWLLVTLLLGNAASYEALPIFLDKLMPEYMAIIVSTTFILFFGEIIPQAVCARYGLQIGSVVAVPVRLLMFLTAPISWPVGKLLDALLGRSDAAFYRKRELKELVYLQGQAGEGDSALTHDEVTIMKGVLDMATKTVQQAMTSYCAVYAVSADRPLDKDFLREVLHEGHSRIPVYEPTDPKRLIGAILTKRLLLEEVQNPPKRVGDLELIQLPYVQSDFPLLELLNMFQTGKSHMAVVADATSGTTVGIITLEDVIEEMIMEEIVDETDQYVNAERKVHVVRNTTKDLGFHSVPIARLSPALPTLRPPSIKSKHGDI